MNAHRPREEVPVIPLGSHALRGDGMNPLAKLKVSAGEFWPKGSTVDLSQAWDTALKGPQE